ncbi:MAG: hypothetical protein EZS28_039578 [Streblomastix strix]|uniref:Uncharacterized protein n=1 Tax=Streblomastix strix TaxID=222440 RepID=A0A5J4U5G4_9EUKA|nr:MAG: hypothetical protein EZS28_039578 [Streblomastix strix]
MHRRKRTTAPTVLLQTYQEHMAQRGTMRIDGKDVDLNQVAKIPDILKNQGIFLKRRMSARQKQQIINQVRAIDPSITQKEGSAGVIGLTNKTKNREVYGPLFDEDLRNEFFENALMLNNEGKLVTQKFIENSQRYEQNINPRLAEPFMQQGSQSPHLNPEQINNEIMHFGSYKQKEKENQRIDDIYDIQSQNEYGQSSFFEDQPTSIPLAQEILIEKQQQAIEKALAQQENLAQVYDPGSLDWGRMPVNDQFNRQQFKTQKTGYQINSDGSLSAIIKNENIKVTPGEKKPKTKKNYIPTSQLLQSANEQGKLSKKKKGKKNSHK